MNKLETDRRAYNEQVKEARLKVKREGKLGRLTKAQEASIKNRSTKAYWAIAKKEVDLEKQAEKIITYKEAFAKIKRETGVNTIQEMVQEFVSSEDQNPCALQSNTGAAP